MPKDGDLLLNLKLRKADILEIETVTPWVPANISMLSWLTESQGKAYIASCDGEPFLVAGVDPIGSRGSGVIWGVGTDLITTGGITFARWGMNFINGIIKDYNHLYNYMDCRNLVHRRYIEACGFTFTGARLMVNGFPFERFELRRDITCVNQHS